MENTTKQKTWFLLDLFVQNEFKCIVASELIHYREEQRCHWSFRNPKTGEFKEGWFKTNELESITACDWETVKETFST